MIWAMGFGGLMVGAGIYLRPARPRNRIATLRRNEAPTLFALLDRISNSLGAGAVDGVQVDDQVNAFLAQYPNGETVVGLGAPLWQALPPQERIALLAHEVAHLVNGDPARGRLARAAGVTLARWSTLFSPPSLLDQECNASIVIDDRGLLEQIVGGIFGGVLGALHLGFERMLYIDSQRAEYLADLKAADVAGKGAVLALLDRLTLVPLGWDHLKTLHVDDSNRDRVLACFAAALRDPAPNQADRLRRESDETAHSVDNTHPPTRYRRDTVRAAGADHAAIRHDSVDWAEIERELASAMARAGSQFADAVTIQ